MELDFESDEVSLEKEVLHWSFILEKKKLSIPKKGKKWMHKSPEAEEELEKRRNEWFQTLTSASRVQKRKVLSIGIWDENLQRIQLTKTKGKQLKSMGYHEDGKYFLYAEEAVYLAESGLLEIYFNDLPLSLVEIHSLLDKDPFLTTSHFLTYTHLKRLGYSVRRAHLPTPPKGTKKRKMEKSPPMKSTKGKKEKKEKKERHVSISKASRPWWPPVITDEPKGKVAVISSRVSCLSLEEMSSPSEIPIVSPQEADYIVSAKSDLTGAMPLRVASGVTWGPPVGMLWAINQHSLTFLSLNNS